MKRMKVPIIIAVFLIMVGILAAIFALDHFNLISQSTRRTQDDERKWEQRVEEQKMDRQKQARKSIYAKLSDENSISMAIIGDNMGFQLGRRTIETGWMDRLQAYIDKIYKSEYAVYDYSYYDWDVFKCYYDFMRQKEEKYDLVFLFFGYNEMQTMSVKEFEYFYEALIRQIQDRCNYPEIMLVLESSLGEYNSYARVIRKLGKYYGYPVADTLAAFKRSPLTVEELTRDNIHPDDKGYQLYFNVISKLIDKGVAEEKEVTRSRPSDWCYEPTYPISEPRTISLGQMTQEGSHTWSYETKYHHVGVLYQAYEAKEGKFTVLLNGEPVKEINTERKLDVEKADIIRLNLQGRNMITIQIPKRYAESTKVDGLVLY